MALEARLANRSHDTGVSLDRLRRRVVFERAVARLAHAEPGRWVLKGGMALEVRLADRARLTKDIDLGLREAEIGPAQLRARLVEAMAVDPYGDDFVFDVHQFREAAKTADGPFIWRSHLAAALAGRPFGAVRLDISPRAHELVATEVVALPNSLEFAEIETTEIEIVDVNRHAAEKLHAMTRDFGERENTRARDLVDLMILIEQEQLDPRALAASTRAVWRERDGSPPPAELPALPESWQERYELMAIECDLATRTCPEATARVASLWTNMLAIEET